MESKKSNGRTVLAHVVLIILAFLCLFFFYILIIPSIASPAVFYFMHSYMQSSLPRELIEAARIDGSKEFGTFNRIVLPIMKPAIAVQAIFTFVGSWNNYFIPALVITSKNKQTLPIMIATLRGADYMNFDMGKIYMMITIAIVPIIIIYLLLSKFRTSWRSPSGRCLFSPEETSI